MNHLSHNLLRLLRLAACLVMLLWLVAEPLPAAEIEMKVCVADHQHRVDIGLLAGGDLYDERNRRVKTLRADEKFVWEVQAVQTQQAPQKTETKGRKDRRAQRPPARRKPDPWLGKTIRFVPRRGQVTVNRQSYHGSLVVLFRSSGATVVNVVKMEDYIRGVVGREMGSQSPLESLKAQAVMARTWAVANRGKHGKDGFDVCSSEHCQVYGGMAAERASTSAAVNATRGIIMTADGFPTSVMYHATCGGATEDNDIVYGGKPLHYLRRVKCTFCKDGTNYRWVRRLPIDFIRRRLAAEKMPFQVLKRVEVSAVKDRDRADRVRFETDKGSYSMKATVFRRIFNLPSTYFWSAGTPSETPRAIEVLMKPVLAAPAPVMPVGIPEEVLTLLTGRRDGGPKQLVVQTSSGLRRAARPGEGWLILSARLNDSAANTAPAASAASGATLPATGRKNPSISRQGAIPVVAQRGLAEISLQGRGYGHQVGMCQAGAVAMGRLGWNYRQILGYYFRGVALRRLP